MDSNEKLISSIVESVIKQIEEQGGSPYPGGSWKLICQPCYNKIRSGNIYSGKNNQWKWSLLDDKPIDAHVWEDCHKCKSFNNGGKRYEARVTKQPITSP